MAMVTTALPRPDEVSVVDAHALLGDEEPPEVDAKTGLPSQLRAFVVLRDPKMTVIPHFFSGPECDHLLELVQGLWMPSLVGQATYISEEDYGKGNLENMLSTTRTSWSCMLRYAQTSVVERLEHRLASVAKLPVEQLERMNMVRYAPGELFDEHHDGKFRPITVFVYLNELPAEEVAGDTFFPFLGVSFTPRRGTAVVWSNVTGDQEDSRMLHAGRAPTLAVKYGVNCFFNIKRMRAVTPTGPDFLLEDAAVVHVGDLGKDSQQGTGEAEPKLVAYRLCPDPKVVAVPNFLSTEEVESLLVLLEEGREESHSSGKRPCSQVYEEGTQTLRLLVPEETDVVRLIEARLASAAGLGLDYLAPLRIVRPGTRMGLCNRGCGPKSAYVCLSDTDELFFPRLGMRLLLRRGDALMWPNVDWASGQAVEDIRTLRVHVRGQDGLAVGLDAFFHDNPVREQQKLRRFMTEDEVAAQVAAAAAAER